MDNNKRALPQIPEPVARSPMFSRSRPGSPSRSPARSQFSTPTASPVRSPVRTHNPFDSHAVDSPDLFHPNTSPTSPVRRLQFSHDDDSDVINVESLSSPVPSTSRPLPQSPLRTSPFDDDFESVNIGSSTNLTSSGLERIPSNGSDQTLANSMSQSWKASKSKTADSSYAEDEDIDDFDTDYDGRSIASFETLSDATVPPSEQPRRNKSMSRKQVKLVRGNLVLDCPVPTKLYSFLPRRDSDEYVYMRYSACTADPDVFAESGFTIRPAIYKRETEICVCITMYNEDEVLFTRTLHAVFKNIAYLCQRSKSKVWGPNGWRKVVVTIISDGRSKINPRVLDCLAAMGIFQDGVAKNFVNGEEVQSHIFEYTAQVSLTPDLKFQGAEKNIVPVQMIFCLKERNAKKINSHRWLFNALCPQLNPNVVVLLDVGTCPSNSTLYHLWKAFDEDSNVAGACGEIKSMVGKFGKSLLNPLVAAQNFEYKMSNIMDKPFESVFGYISVLPGALSAYRWRALQNHEDGTGPLASYFKGEKLDSVNAGIFEKNMYLAEDRILCWELVAKRGDKWVLKYVKPAKGITDVPDNMPELISQRRRWLNGALFAAVYSLTHFKQIWATDHSPVRKFFLHVEFLYQLANLIFTFFSIANYFLAFYFLAGSVSGHNSAAIGDGVGLALFLLFKYILIIAISAQFVLSLGNRPQGSKTLFVGTTVMLSLTMTYTMIISLYFVIKTLIDPASESTGVLVTIVFSLAATYGVYGLMSLLYCDPWHMLTSSIQYFLQLPLYSVTLQIYAFCNTHDVTWGTKGDNEQKMDLGAAVVNKIAGSDVVEVEMPSEQVDIDTGYENALHSLRERAPVSESQPSQATADQDYFREIRTRVVLVWMTANLLLVLLITQFFSLDHPGKNVYLQIVLWSTAAFALMRATGSFVFLMQYVARKILKANYHTGIKWRQAMNKVQGKIEPAA